MTNAALSLALMIYRAAYASAVPLEATVLHPIDGDTFKVHVKAWEGTPLEDVSLRIFGIDTPESHMPPGKCAAEVVKGQAASTFARTLIKAGDTVTFTFRSIDKYGDRVDADVTLSDGRDWGQLMISTGNAAAYDGGTKRSWCD